MATGEPKSMWRRAVDALSFSSELYRLRRELNARIDAPPEDSGKGPRSHPLGVSRYFKRRRISIAEAYIRVVNDLDSSHAKSRLRALRLLVDTSFHAKTFDMPLNTARVQLALVKEAIKHRGDRRRQLEALQDFSHSSHGRYQVIRRLLDEHNMLELPETGRPLRELDAGWDNLVHETSTSGRKNATQLLLDAFIKGMSRLTIAYESLSSLEQMEEALEAGRIVGVRVDLGIQFSLNRCGRRFHFMALLPEMRRPRDLRNFLEANRRNLRELLAGIEENRESRMDSIRRLMRHFNETELGVINQGFPKSELYRLRRLRMRDFIAYAPLAAADRSRLGDFLHARLKPVLFNRIMLLKVRRERAARELRRGGAEARELRAVEERLELARAEYRELGPDRLHQRHFAAVAVGEYASVLDDLERLRARLSEARCAIRLVHPLEHGQEKALELLRCSAGLLDEIEIWNNHDCARRPAVETEAFCRAVNEENRRRASDGEPPLVPVCGSDATGRVPGVPGMGFVFADRIGPRAKRRYLARHARLPGPVAALAAARGAPVDLDAPASFPVLVGMGKLSEPQPNLVGDERLGDPDRIGPLRAFRYLNPTLVGLLRVAVGFLVARSFVGDGYALLWLGITAFRNTVADLVALRGTRLREWNVRSVDLDNVAQSLFWTGFSVPILGFVKARFDLLWPFAAAGFAYEAAKFFFISGTNGLYLASHNRLRGFDRKVVRANFFRSVLSWPFATLFAPAGEFLGIPSIVQAKIWSDVVAGFIEGGGKYVRILRLRRRDLEEIIPRVGSEGREERCTAVLDLLYLWREEPRTRSSLAAIFAAEAGAGEAPPGGGGPRAALGAALGREKLDRELLDYILGEYAREGAVDLVDLVARCLPELREWLASRGSAAPLPLRVLT